MRVLAAIALAATAVACSSAPQRYTVFIPEPMTDCPHGAAVPRGLPAIVGLVGFVSLLTALILKTPWPVTPTALQAKVSVMGLGKALMGIYVFPFEVISIILIAALIGTVVIAKKDAPEDES